MYTYELWDRQTAINGVEAKQAAEIHRLPPEGAVGLVRDSGGKVVLFQYDRQHPYSEENLLEKLAAMAAEMNGSPAEEKRFLGLFRRKNGGGSGKRKKKEGKV